MICGLTLRSWSCDPLLLGLRDYSWGLFSLAAGLRPGTRQEILPESLGDWITKCYRLPQHLGEDVGISRLPGKWIHPGAGNNRQGYRTFPGGGRIIPHNDTMNRGKGYPNFFGRVPQSGNTW